jgi:hypothetical protein
MSKESLGFNKSKQQGSEYLAIKPIAKGLLNTVCNALSSLPLLH